MTNEKILRFWQYLIIFLDMFMHNVKNYFVKKRTILIEFSYLLSSLFLHKHTHTHTHMHTHTYIYITIAPTVRVSYLHSL